MYQNPNPILEDAKAICMQCGSAQVNPLNGRCKNNHEDWLELNDHDDRFKEASNRFKMLKSKLIYCIQKSMDCKVDEKIRNRELISKILVASQSISKSRESKAEYIVVSQKYLEKVMKDNNLSSTKESEELLIDVLAGTKTMKHE